MNQYDILKNNFGYTSFRDGQEPLINAILSGRDAFGVMPTGGGKSICYQIPAVLLQGITLVISPLISLMKDQVMALREANIPAAYINSTLSSEQLRAVHRNLERGKYKLVYIAPERLDNENFSETLRHLPICLLVVDEAHCISQWGQDFRPSYLKIVDFVASLPRRPVLAAFTATATMRVREDVIHLLGLRNPLLLVTGFDRPNLRYEVIRANHKNVELRSLLAERLGQSGIVYCSTRGKVERVCADLLDTGFSATRYHAGLSDEERHKNQEDFIYDRSSVMVATNAFGMGIDKSNVRFVIHYNMPKSIEEYYQEAGRAGRDGEAADCILLFSAGDVSTAKYLIEHSDLEGEKSKELTEQDLQRLYMMVGYCKTNRCLRGYILDYFGQKHKETCGNCGNCLGLYDEVDITTQAQMVLSCVKRIHDRLGYSVGAGLVLRTLRGSTEKRVMDLELDHLSTYGLLRSETSAQIQGYIEQLEFMGYLAADPRHEGIELTEAANDVLFRGKTVRAMVKRDTRKNVLRGKMKSAATDASADDGLFQALRVLRRNLADKEGVAAYIVFSDATLRDMARRKPHNLGEFLEVAGVGKYKAEKYGKAFLNKIAEYEEEKDDEP